MRAFARMRRRMLAAGGLEPAAAPRRVADLHRLRRRGQPARRQRHLLRLPVQAPALVGRHHAGGRVHRAHLEPAQRRRRSPRWPSSAPRRPAAAASRPSGSWPRSPSRPRPPWRSGTTPRPEVTLDDAFARVLRGVNRVLRRPPDAGLDGARRLAAPAARHPAPPARLGVRARLRRAQLARRPRLPAGLLPGRRRQPLVAGADHGRLRRRDERVQRDGHARRPRHHRRRDDLRPHAGRREPGAARRPPCCSTASSASAWSSAWAGRCGRAGSCWPPPRAAAPDALSSGSGTGGTDRNAPCTGERPISVPGAGHDLRDSAQGHRLGAPGTAWPLGDRVAPRTSAGAGGRQRVVQRGHDHGLVEDEPSVTHRPCRRIDGVVETAVRGVDCPGSRRRRRWIWRTPRGGRRPARGTRRAGSPCVSIAQSVH